MRTEQTAFAFMQAGDHEVVIFGVLKRLNIRPYQDHYQDLVQDSRLEFIDAYLKYPHDYDNEKQLLNYIYQSIKWKLLDQLRRQTRLQQGIEIPGGVDDPFANLAFTDEVSANSETKLVYEKVLTYLSADERRLLNGLFIEGKTISQLAVELNVSRKTLYQWRLKIKTKIKPIWGDTSRGPFRY
ncbi:sigma-70 family RNA polymerase sigma factor [Fructilactobacillus vespulae]|uniref:sigma-70 family RNA polymerase sigma factor n=1 Tax=Fructilactobacillus vespulae TaxID=1249630 RepID=UPI0039B67469